MAIWKPLGVVWGSIWGSFWAPFWAPGRVMPLLRKIAPRHSESKIFRGVQKRAQNGYQNSFQRQPGSKSVLGASRARFSSMLGLIWGFPHRSKNVTKNELILGPGPGGPRGPQELRSYPPGVVLGGFGGPGGDYRGGNLGSESQI